MILKSFLIALQQVLAAIVAVDLISDVDDPPPGWAGQDGIRQLA